MKVGPFATEQAFTEHVVALVADPKRAFLTVDGPDGKALGWLCLMEAKPAHRVVELGYVLYTPPLQRTGLAAHRLAAEPRAGPRADETRRPSVLCGGSAVEKVPRLNRRSLRVADAGC